MSLSFQKVRPVECRDPRVIVDNGIRDYAVLTGGSDITPKTYSTTNIAQNSISFTTLPPSANTIIDRKAFLTVCVRLSFTGTVPAGGYLLNVNRDAPRAYPLSSALDTVGIQINGTKVSVDMADVVQALMRFNNDAKVKNLDYSMTPTAMDESQNYGDLVNTIRNPLAVYGDANQESVVGRGSSNYAIVSNPQNNTASPATLTSVIDCRFTEPIFMLTPFIWGKHQSGGLYNITTLDWTFNWLTQAANRFWSHDASSGSSIDGALSTFTFGGQVGGPTTPGFNQSPTLLLTWITPPETAILGPNLSITYPYFNIERLGTDFTGILPGPNNYVVYPSANIQLKSIPRRLYVYMRQRNSKLYASPSNTDTYMSINNVNIQFNNRSGIYSTASQEQLYQTAVKNHCNMSWQEWSGLPQYSGAGNFTTQFYGVGSICCFEFGTDIANQSALECPGRSGQYQLQVNVSAANISSQTLDATLYVVPVYEGTLTIPNSGASILQIGVLSANDVLDAGKNGYVSYNDVQKVNGGGDFFSNIKDFFSEKVLPLIKQSRVASNLANLIPVAGPALSKSLRNIGYGDGDGGVLVGGEALSRSQLRRRLRN
jgi:hypothetical protein